MRFLVGRGTAHRDPARSNSPERISIADPELARPKYEQI
jgi:hypothetical protein